MLCAIYKSPRKEGMYLYVPKRDDFSRVPAPLREQFGRPIFVMLFNLAGKKPLVQVDNTKLQTALEQDGFYFYMPPPQENLLKKWRETQAKS